MFFYLDCHLDGISVQLRRLLVGNIVIDAVGIRLECSFTWIVIKGLLFTAEVISKGLAVLDRVLVCSECMQSCQFIPSALKFLHAQTNAHTYFLFQHYLPIVLHCTASVRRIRRALKTAFPTARNCKLLSKIFCARRGMNACGGSRSPWEKAVLATHPTSKMAFFNLCICPLCVH